VEAVKTTRSVNADSFLKELLDKVNQFVGGAAQHDDLTAIVVNVTR
jgi:hypothetical protein